MMMKSSKVKKIVVGVDNDSVHAEQATTSSDILNLDSLSVGRFMWSKVPQNSISEYLIFKRFPRRHAPKNPLAFAFRNVLCPMPFAMTLFKDLFSFTITKIQQTSKFF